MPKAPKLTVNITPKELSRDSMSALFTAEQLKNHKMISGLHYSAAGKYVCVRGKEAVVNDLKYSLNASA